MIFSKISLGLNSIASKLMGISFCTQNKLAWYAEVDGKDVLTGTSNFWLTVWVLIRKTFADLLEYTYELIIKLIYAIGKWALTIIDFIFIFIREVIGMNTDFSSFEDVTDSDIIFQFIFNQKVIIVIRNLILFSLVLIILFSIIAIIISEYKYISGGGDNSKKNIFVNALKSIFLMMFVPVLAVGGIVMTNAVLKALYIATAGGQDTTLSNQIFIASTYNANAYRNYAINNKKIPVTYNFSTISDDDNVTSYGTEGGVKELENALEEFKNNDALTRGWKTFLMFETDGFLDMKDVDELEIYYKSINKLSPYNQAYDVGLESRADQYYIMADVVDWAMKTGTNIYFKTAEEIYKSYYNVLNKIGSSPDIPNYMPIYMSGGNYCYDVWYKGDIDTTTYTHISGRHDEAKGAKFLVAIEKSVTMGAGNSVKTYSYYYPLLTGRDAFASDYAGRIDNVVVAKGVFDEGEYPTAIREQDGVVKFYRDDLNVPALVDLFPHISYELPEGTTEELGTRILKGAFKLITGVDVNQFVPYIYFNFDIFSLYTKSEHVIAKIPNGQMQVNYNFTQRGYSIINLYDMGNFNILIFFSAIVLLLGILLKLLFGIVLRVLDITLLAISYPAVLSAMPLDNGSRFKTWTETFVKKLLSIYGVVVGINLVLLVCPIIYSVEIFSPADIQKAYTFKLLPISFASYYGAGIVNFILQFLFVFVSFSSIEKFIKITEGLATNWQAKDDDKDMETSKKLGAILKDGENVVNDLKKLPQKAADIISYKVVVDAVDKVKSTLTGFIPGSAIISELKKDKADKLQQEYRKQNIKEVKDAAKAGDFEGFNRKNDNKDGKSQYHKDVVIDPNKEFKNFNPNNRKS